VTRRFTAAALAAVSAVAGVVGGATSASGRADARPATGPGLELRPVLTELPSVTATPPTPAPVDLRAAAAAVATCDPAAVAALPVVPTTAGALARAGDCVVFPARVGGKAAPRYYLGPAAVTGPAVARAHAEFVSGQGWTVRLELTKAGAKAWDALAGQQFHQQVAVAVRGEVVSAPTIEPSEQEFRSFEGVAVISASFTQRQALALAALARRGRTVR
jgi:hypothetical protein